MAVTHSAEDERSEPRRESRWPYVPPNYFAIALGLAGLAAAWQDTVPVLRTPVAVPRALDILAAVVWLGLVVAYVRQGPQVIRGHLRHPVMSPFPSIALITGMLLSGALATVAATAGRVLVVVFLAATIALGGWLTGQWMTGGTDQDAVHPGYFLPTVAGGLVGAECAAEVHLRGLAEASFGIGVICWLLLGSAILNRLFTRPALPPALAPTMAIETAPPAVAGLAWFAIAGPGRLGPAVSVVAYLLGGYAVLMVLAQARLSLVYSRLSFTPGFWAFAFSYSAAVADGLTWLALKKPPGATAYAIAAIAVLTGFVAWIAARTVRLAVRGQLFPTS